MKEVRYYYTVINYQKLAKEMIRVKKAIKELYVKVVMLEMDIIIILIALNALNVLEME